MGFKFTYKSVCCALGGCRCVVKSCLPMVASGLGLRLYLEKHLRERERERERSLRVYIEVSRWHVLVYVTFVVFLVFVLGVNVLFILAQKFLKFRWNTWRKIENPINSLDQKKKKRHVTQNWEFNWNLIRFSLNFTYYYIYKYIDNIDINFDT